MFFSLVVEVLRAIGIESHVLTCFRIVMETTIKPRMMMPIQKILSTFDSLWATNFIPPMLVLLACFLKCFRKEAIPTRILRSGINLRITLKTLLSEHACKMYDTLFLNNQGWSRESFPLFAEVKIGE